MHKIFNRATHKFCVLSKRIRWEISREKMHKFTIQPYEVGQRIDRYLKKTQIGWISGQKCLRKKQIVICRQDGTIINDSNYKIQQGDYLLVSNFYKDSFSSKKQLDQSRLVPKEQATRILRNMIVFDNQNITIINKKAGFSVQGGPNPKSNLFSLMCSKYQKQLIHITHRLDKGTSGVVILAKNKQTAQIVQTSMEEQNMFSKFYLALTQGYQIVNKQGYIRSNIQWTGKNKARICNQAEKTSKDCITFYMPIQSWQTGLKQLKPLYRNMLGIKLLTGRKHQIRCHLSGYLQQPIVNDLKYNGPSEFSKSNKDLSQNQDYHEQEQQSKIFLHAFGLRIYKKQLLQKIISNKRYTLNDQLGQMHYSEQQGSLTFTAKVPQMWSTSKSTMIYQKLLNLSQIIESTQKNMKKVLPSKRIITTIQ